MQNATPLTIRQMEKENIIIPNEIINNKIYFIRGNKVMLDADLALLFNVTSRRLRQQVTRNIDKFPEHFTEHGVLQLANVLKSERATQMSIKIIEVFVSLRDFLTDNLNLKLEVDIIKKKLINHDKNIELVFTYLDELMDKQENKIERTKIGYKK